MCNSEWHSLFGGIFECADRGEDGPRNDTKNVCNIFYSVVFINKKRKKCKKRVKFEVFGKIL
jgi:hypothetical protein